MDRGVWQATVHRVTRVGHNLVTEHMSTNHNKWPQAMWLKTVDICSLTDQDARVQSQGDNMTGFPWRFLSRNLLINCLFPSFWWFLGIFCILDFRRHNTKLLLGKVFEIHFKDLRFWHKNIIVKYSNPCVGECMLL